MAHESVRIIHEEHAALAAMLQSLRMMIQRGPGDAPEQFFDVLRAMLFYIDEFPERQHHPKESSLLFPPLRTRAPHLKGTLERLERDHDRGEAAVRELQHLLLAWELLGESRRSAFEVAMLRHLDFYLEHMRVEETEVLPEAVRHLTPQDWAALDAAFASNQDPLTGKYPRDPLYDRLFTRIVMRTPAPIGVGAG
ncbi:MAG: hemerythrin domain-containing protein [Hylemonella sp.]|jgi:hemerythrin-like domain-containing protein|uniref:hemerythrin domain-containing protein n=1 Tax=Hylemonella sp. TaxID=2066020 RepID=UPI00391900B3